MFSEHKDGGSVGFIIECTDELIKWAKSVDPWQEIIKLAEHEKIYEDYNHLAALALTGDRDQFDYYLKFREEHPNPKEEPWVSGTLGPLITKENIERAIKIAIKHQEEPII